MSGPLVVLSFFAIALMRVIQKVCSRKVANQLTEKTTFFQYGAYYQFISAAFSVIMLCITGFHGFNWETVLCALLTAVCFGVDLFAGVEALKGATLAVCNMVSMGSLFIPCVVGIFLFDEPMSVMQWVGLVIFVSAIYFLASDSKKLYKKFTLKTFLMLLTTFIINGLVTIVQKYFAILVPDGNVAMFSFLTFALNSAIMFVCMWVCIGLTKATQKKQPTVTALPQETAPKEEEQATPKKDKKILGRLNKVLLICGFLLAIAVFVINWLVTTMAKTVESVVLFTVSGAIAIIITSIVGAVVYGEKITVKNIIGLVLGLSSIIIVNVF